MGRLTLAFALLFMVSTHVYPCSNKYAGRNATVLMQPSVRPASILILNNKSLRIYAKSLKTTLQQLGYKVKEVNSPEKIANALNSKQAYDIVMADVGQVGALAEQIKAADSNAITMPLISKNSKEGALSTEEYPFAVNLSSKSTIIRKKIEKAMEMREKSAKEDESKDEV